MSGFSKERDREGRRPSMDSKQIMDSLTDHIALYNSSSSSSSSSPNPNPNPRAAILRWFSALSVHNRRACLTVVDLDFTELLLQMRGRLETHGHGFFLVLPDIPSSPSRPSLPSLCFRRSRGLLARTSASDGFETRISDSVRLFSSRDGEDRSVLGPIDSVTVSEEFVEDVDGFLAAMDAVSHGGFLGGDENISWSPWEELSWLKVKGFYSLEAFVVNRLELALRMSWSCNCGGKKRAVVRMKDKVAEAAVGLAGNVFWRKKGCLDWWDGLDPGVRKKMILTFLGKAAQPLANEIVKGTNGVSKDEQWFFNIGVKQPLLYGPTTSHKRLNRSLIRSDQDFFCGIVPASVSSKPPHLVNTLNGLSVLMEISSIVLAVQHTELDKEKFFFSTLGSVQTVSDFILRRMRGTLMMVSIDHTKHELFGDANRNVSYVKTKEKAEVGCRRGNNKSHNMKGMNHVPKPSMVDGALQKPVVARARGSACTLDRSSMPCHQINHLSKRGNGKLSESCNCIKEKDRSQGVDSSGMEMEQSVGLANHKVTTTRKKKGRKRTRAKKSYLETGQDAASNAAPDIREAVSSSISVKSEPAVPFSSASNTTILADEFSVEDGHSENTCCNTSVIEDKIEAAIAIQKDSLFVSTGGNSDAGVECFQNPDKSEGQNVVMHASICPEGEGISHTALPGPSIESMKICCDRNNQSVNESTNQSVNESTSEPVPSLEKNVVYEKDSIQSGGNNCFIHNHSSSNGNTYSSSNGNTSYEWPSVAPLHFPPIDLQRIPAATDRLHLDVARNWPNHSRQPIFTSRHHVRNPSFENGCSRVITSSTLPMSLDWPPVVRNVSRLVQPVSCNYDSAYTPRLHSSFLGMTAHGMQVNGMINEGERRYPGDFIDSCSLKIGSDLVDDNENQWISEEESDMHTLSGGDYNQFFGGGVMYWNASDHGGSGFSHPPSHSSEDGSWAWHEDDLNRAIDDMVGKPVMSSSYSTGGLASPLSASFESPFDLGSGHQPVGYILSGNDVNGKLLQTSQTGADVHQDKGPGSVNKSSCGSEGATGDSLPYPILRPIIVPKISRGSRSEFMLSRDLKSPCIATGRRELSRIKRPPSPVVLCVSQSPRPPPPSPVGDSRKQRGFPTVRSGSSSPRQWGIRNWYNDGAKFEEACICLDGPEVFWPHWGNKGLATTPIIQPLSGPLLQEQMIAISQLPRDHEHPDVTLPVQPPEVSDCPIQKTSLSMMHGLLHEEIEFFCKQVAAANLIKKPYIDWAVEKVARSLQVLWPRSRTNVFGSNATGLALPTSDVDLVVCLPPVHNLEPIREAGILEGRNGIKETCIQHAARYLANQDWVKNDSLKTIENTAIPVIMLVAEVPHDGVVTVESTSTSQIPEENPIQMIGEHVTATHSETFPPEDLLGTCPKMNNDEDVDMKSVRLDISFKSTSHTGLQTTELVRQLTQKFPAAIPLALVLKRFLADRSLDRSYSGGLSSHCLVLLIIRFLQHEHHIGRPMNQDRRTLKGISYINKISEMNIFDLGQTIAEREENITSGKNLGSLLMDFLYFFGNVFDPRRMRISIHGSGVYVNRERGHSIDPLHIDDPLYPTNNVGRNCFRIHQCIKAFADAYTMLKEELTSIHPSGDPNIRSSIRLLPKIISSIKHE